MSAAVVRRKELDVLVKLSAVELDRYEDTIGRSVRPAGPTSRQPAGGSSDRDPTCHTRPRIEVHRGPLLNWRDASHWSHLDGPCRYCGGITNLRDDANRPAHKVCAEAQLDR